MQVVAIAVPSRASGHYHQGTPLDQHAAQLYPDSAHNQAAWISAVQFLRRGRVSGWTLDRPVTATRNINRY